MKTILALAAVAFAGITTVTLAGAPPCPSDCAPDCKPVKVMLVEAPSCSAAPSCAGESRCHGRSRPSLAERRAERIAGRCAARDARAEARAAARASCSGVQVVRVVECCEPVCAEGGNCK